MFWLKGFAALMIVALWSQVVKAEAVFTFHDDFSSYPANSDGSPNWFSYAVGWEVKDRTLTSIGDAPGANAALVQKAPFGTRVTTEATVSISKSMSADWKIAGVVLFADSQHFWHCALVEAPEGTGRKHYIELAEMLDGQWPAQGNLKTTSFKGGDFNWQYDHPYRLRVALTPEGISGSVSELKGEKVFECTYAFENNQAVRYGKAGLDCSGFTGAFADVDVSVDEVKEVAAPVRKFPPYQVNAWTGFQSRATGFFHTEERKGVWWLIDPKGHPFYVVGADHCNYYAHWCEKLGYAPYHRNCEKKFGRTTRMSSEQAWAESATARLKSWNFNTVAAGHIPSTRYHGLAHIPILGLGQSFARIDDLCKPINWTGFPNVFSPRWERACEKQALALCEPNKEDPWLIGYFIDNELEWYGKDWSQGLLGEAFKKPAEHTCKQAVIDFFRKRYPDVAEFNAAWKATLKDFDDLRTFTPTGGPPTDKAAGDRDAFAGLVAERYFSVTAAAIRKADPNHTVLGCRFAGEAPETCWAPAGKHCDVVSVNYYGSVDLDRGVAIDFAKTFDHRYSLCRKPMMLTEWSFPALDSGLPCTVGAGQRFDTQEQRAQAWTIYQRTLFTLPYMVGSDYFMWVDEPALGISSAFPENTNYGLVNEQDEPYPLLVAAAAKLNAQVYQIHESGDRKSIAGKPVSRRAALNAIPDLSNSSNRPVTFHRTDQGYEIDNGVFILKKDKPDGDLLNEVIFKGINLGRLQFLVWQWGGQDLWLPPEKIVSVHEAQASPLILDLTVAQGSESSNAITAVNDEGKFTPRYIGARPHAYRAGVRIVVAPDKPYFFVQLLWLQNVDRDPWQWRAYYHYPVSGIGGSSRDDEPAMSNMPNYYLNFGGWWNDKIGAGYGALPLYGDDFRVTFWKDPGGNEHPDFMREIGVALKPGERYSKPQPPGVIFGALGKREERPWLEVLREVRRTREGKWRSLPAASGVK